MKTPDENGLSERRANLDAALAKKASEQPVETGSKTSGNAGWGLGVKISSEFIAGIIVGAALGYLLDTIAGTAPWGMIVMLLLGFGAGVLNVLRATGKVTEPDNRMGKFSADETKNDAGNGKDT